MAISDGFINLGTMGTITNPYGAAAPSGVTYATGKHTGLDLVLNNKNKTITSLTSGTVDKTGYDPDGWGNYVWVKNANDGYYTLYAHLKTSPFVHAGQKVTTGSVLGTEGATGQATGNHLHLEVRKDKSNATTAVDPSVYFSGIKADSNAWSGSVWNKRASDTAAYYETNGSLADKVAAFIKEFWNDNLATLTRVILFILAVALIYIVFRNGILGGKA